MDITTLKKSPYFDPVQARHDLTKIFTEKGSAGDARPAVLDYCKRLLKNARTTAEAQLSADGNGRRCATGLSHFTDELIRLIYDYTTAHVYRATNPSDAERMAIVATGGFGRGLLAPSSDIDLLFLLPYKQTPWGESVAEYMLYLLWDLGLKVGHATRTVDQCLKLAVSDFTILTALLDQRLIHGDEKLYREHKKRFWAEVVTSSMARRFVEAKMAERDERHRRTGESRYLVEPNVKDGKGGLRDLHTLHWLAMYLYGQGLGSGLATAGVFMPSELATFRRCENFLWSVRCHLHFLTGRAEERLSFDLQPIMAERLGYRSHSGLRSVERFMKHYFLVAKDVGDLTTILCSSLEMQQLKAVPQLKKINPVTWVTRRRIRNKTDFRIDNERLNVSDPDVFKRDPVNLIQFFAVAEETGSFFHPSAVRLLRQSLRLIDDDLRNNPEANRIFLDLLTSKQNPEATLRRMNEVGVLGRFIPEFGRIVAMMQFNMYHHYTVDEHSLRTVGELSAIENGQLARELPLSTEIFGTIQNRRALYVATFLHDIGKGRTEDHSIVGARIARKICPRLGLSGAETETVAWLIENHLVMSNIAQSRDLADPKTIRDFADIVQSPERLKLLLLLTVADIRAVGPGTWNGWKGQLLRELYWETEPLVAGGHTQISRRERIAEAQAALRAELKDWPPEEVERFIQRHYDDYWLKTETRKQVEHAKLIRDADAKGLRLATSFTTNAFTATTELSILAPNHPRLLALFAGACAAAGANIIGAHISTTRDGLALDTFILQREFVDDADEARRINSITRIIERALNGEVRMAGLMAKRKPSERRITAFTVEPEAIINNALSDKFSVIEVSGRDRPGLLYDLTSTLSDLNLDITSAHITTYGEKAVDVFYVTDLTGKKVTNEQRQATIRQRLVKVLSQSAEAA